MEIQQREMIEYKIIQAFKEHRGNDPVSFERMKGDASHRTLYRLKGFTWQHDRCVRSQY